MAIRASDLGWQHRAQLLSMLLCDGRSTDGPTPRQQLSCKDLRKRDARSGGPPEGLDRRERRWLVGWSQPMAHGDTNRENLIFFYSACSACALIKHGTMVNSACPCWHTCCRQAHVSSHDDEESGQLFVRGSPQNCLGPGAVVQTLLNFRVKT